MKTVQGTGPGGVLCDATEGTFFLLVFRDTAYFYQAQSRRYDRPLEFISLVCLGEILYPLTSIFSLATNILLPLSISGGFSVLTSVDKLW